ncbi:hypothetical protein CW704_04310 [Candidatus Bathyarchaeota archaeon]|nr:MAG: hypothetical protein CW704_04310 [Candidatus Bathyarchaeota archaeon]
MKKIILVTLFVALFLSAPINPSYGLKHKRHLLLVGATAYRSLIELYPTNDINVTYLGYGSDFPNTLKELKQYDVIMFANIDTHGFNPHLSNDEMKNIMKFVEEGGTFIMAGGYGSFGGYNDSINYPDVVGYDETPIEKILPVEILHPNDTYWRDFVPQVLKKHFLTNGIFKHHPTMHGLNLVKAKEDSIVLADDGDGHPFLVIGKYKKGRVLAFTSDIGPGWGSEYIFWKHAEEFWHRVMIWATDKKF